LLKSNKICITRQNAFDLRKIKAVGIGN